MSRRLSELHHNEKVFLDRIELNLLASNLTLKPDERNNLIEKVIKRASSEEAKKCKPFMYVAVRVWELKKLFPDWKTNPPLWWERHK